MKFPTRDVLLDQLPVTPGAYYTRNGRRAVVTDTNDSLSDGYLEPFAGSARRSCCWSTRNGWAAGVGRGGWDLVKRIDQ